VDTDLVVVIVLIVNSGSGKLPLAKVTATAAEATTVAAVTLIFNAAATMTVAQSAADSGQNGNDGSAVIAMQ
jgi:hypothetical protein